jgi:hypothetical protein
MLLRLRLPGRLLQLPGRVLRLMARANLCMDNLTLTPPRVVLKVEEVVQKVGKTQKKKNMLLRRRCLETVGVVMGKRYNVMIEVNVEKNIWRLIKQRGVLRMLSRQFLIGGEKKKKIVEFGKI